MGSLGDDVGVSKEMLATPLVTGANERRANLCDFAIRFFVPTESKKSAHPLVWLSLLLIKQQYHKMVINKKRVKKNDIME
jgi:hypothetical protein